MRQYWRLQQSQAIASLLLWTSTITLLVWPYVRWRFEGDDTILGFPTTYWGLVLIGSGVILVFRQADGGDLLCSLLIALRPIEGFQVLKKLGLCADTSLGPLHTYFVNPNIIDNIGQCYSRQRT